MLQKVLSTMRVLVDGPTDEKEDVKLIPTNIFDTRENFNDAVVQLLEKADVVNVFDFIKYAICIDTSIRHRLEENTIETYIDGALIQPGDYVDLLNKIDSVFGVTDEAAGVNIVSGTQNTNPAFSGLSGAFLEVALEYLGEDQYDVLKGFIKVNYESCIHNPSTTSIWWLDTLDEIYSYETPVEGEEDLWFDPNGEIDQKFIIQTWFLRLNNCQGEFWDVWVTANQTVPENSIVFELLKYFIDLKISFVNRYEDRLENYEGVVCDRVPFLENEGVIYNIEKCLMVTLLGGM